MALKRLRYELKKFAEDPNDAAIRAGPVSDADLYVWWATIDGPEDTPFEGGKFDLSIEFPTEYPFKPPKVKFKTKVFHPNISRRGTVCVDILQKNWSPAITTAKMLLSICSLLASPNPDDPMDAESADLYISNPREYERKAKEWTRTFAMQTNQFQSNRVEHKRRSGQAGNGVVGSTVPILEMTY